MALEPRIAIKLLLYTTAGAVANAPANHSGATKKSHASAFWDETKEKRLRAAFMKMDLDGGGSVDFDECVRSPRLIPYLEGRCRWFGVQVGGVRGRLRVGDDAGG